MARDAFEFDVGGELRDRYGRPEYVLTPKHAVPLSIDTSRAYQPTDADGRLQIALQDQSGVDIATDFAVIKEAPLNVQWTEFAGGAKGNDIADDTAAINAAVAKVPIHSIGTGYSGGEVFIPNGSYRTSGPILLPEGVKLRGETSESVRLLALPSFVGAAMISNTHTDGTQESAYVENLTLHGNSTGGATSGDGILFSGLFVNSAVRHVLVSHCSGNGIHVTMAPTGLGSGPVFLEDINSFTNQLDLILIEKGFQSITCEDLALETPAAGHHGLHIAGGAGVNSQNGRRVNLRNIYIETANANTAGVWIESTSSVLLDGLFLGGVSAAGQAAVRLTGANSYLTGTRGVELRNLWTLFNQGAVLVDDQVRGQQVLNETSPGYCDRYYSEAAVLRTPPAVPATTVSFTNPFGFDNVVYIAAGASSTTVQTAAGTSFAVIPANTLGTIHWPAGVTFKLVYASAPTWNWVTR